MNYRNGGIEGDAQVYWCGQSNWIELSNQHGQGEGPNQHPFKENLF